MHTLKILNWHPVRLNQLLRVHWGKANKLKASDRGLVNLCAKAAGIPKARGRRRVTLRIVLGPRQRAGDPDSYWKSLLDALVHCELLVEDNRRWVELAPVEFGRAKQKRTEIMLEDLDGRAAA